MVRPDVKAALRSREEGLPTSERRCPVAFDIQGLEKGVNPKIDTCAGGLALQRPANTKSNAPTLPHHALGRVRETWKHEVANEMMVQHLLRGSYWKAVAYLHSDFGESGVVLADRDEWPSSP